MASSRLCRAVDPQKRVVDTHPFLVDTAIFIIDNYWGTWTQAQMSGQQVGSIINLRFRLIHSPWPTLLLMSVL